jgi:phospholipid/cholesterol/gamma-HCH transport system substrate-binding protein
VNKQWMQFSIGVVTILSLFALAAIVVWFGELQWAFRPKQTYYVTFTNALGAEPKAPVRRAGMRIGEISQVEYDHKTSLVVATLALDNGNRLFEGDEPRLRVNSLLVGDAYIDVETRPDRRGKPDRKVIPPGSIVEGRPPLDLGPTAESVTSIVPNANRTLEDLGRASQQWTTVGERASRILEQNEKELNRILTQTRDAVERLNDTLTSVNDTLDKKTQQNIRTTVQNLADASNDLQPLLESGRDTLRQIDNTTKRLDAVAANLQTATKPLAQHGDATIRNLDAAAHNIAGLSGELAVMLKRFQSSNGTLKRLLEDPRLYQHLDDAAVKLDGSLADLQIILKDLQVFSDKIARHPGELGVQGVLTRDSGAKNTPPSVLNREGRTPRE